MRVWVRLHVGNRVREIAEGARRRFWRRLFVVIVVGLTFALKSFELVGM